MTVDLRRVMRTGRRHSNRCTARLCVQVSTAVHAWVECEKNSHSASVKHKGTLEDAAWRANDQSPMVRGEIEIQWP